MFGYRGEPEPLLANADEVERYAREQSIPVLSNALVPIGRGLALRRMGRAAESVSLLRKGIGGWNAAGGHLDVPYMKTALAEALLGEDGVEGALALIEECLDQIERPAWQERVWLPEVLRWKGRSLRIQGKDAEAEEQLRASIACTRQQEARSRELRSTTTLAELLMETGRRDEARGAPEAIYGSFTEGWETQDLKAARGLADRLR